MRLLIVEDETTIADSLKKGLEQESYAVDVAYDGETGFDLAVAEEYDVLILDIMLPGMNGVEVCRKLREEEVQTPILMLTAKGEIEDKTTGLNIGADDYLVKPFAFEELLARLKALTRRPKQQLQTILTANDLVLDTVTYQVTRNDKEIKLTKREFALLEYLLRNKGQIVTKDQLIAHVWDYDADVLPNTVEVYVGYVRNKVDKAFRNKPGLITTVRGFGYKIEE